VWCTAPPWRRPQLQAVGCRIERAPGAPAITSRRADVSSGGVRGCGSRQCSWRAARSCGEPGCLAVVTPAAGPRPAGRRRRAGSPAAAAPAPGSAGPACPRRLVPFPALRTLSLLPSLAAVGSQNARPAESRFHVCGLQACSAHREYTAGCTAGECTPAADPANPPIGAGTCGCSPLPGGGVPGRSSGGGSTSSSGTSSKGGRVPLEPAARLRVQGEGRPSNQAAPGRVRCGNPLHSQRRVHWRRLGGREAALRACAGPGGGVIACHAIPAAPPAPPPPPPPPPVSSQVHSSRAAW
jgi:hypothetical protein